VNVTFNVARESDTVMLIKSRISNNTAQPVTDLTFQVAVSKGYSLSLEPQSSVSLAPNQANGITQTIRLNGVPRGAGDRVKMRWKAAYAVSGQRREEHGEIPSLGVA